LGITDSTSDIIAQVDAAWDNPAKCLMHPDITPANLVRTADNHWQVIDNELLTVGGLPVLDLCNAAYALGPHAGQELVRLYLGDTNRRLSEDEVFVLNDFWFARRLGSEFVAGKIAAAGDLLVRYRMKQTILPANFQSENTP
jgi:hypothetical protein